MVSYLGNLCLAQGHRFSAAFPLSLPFHSLVPGAEVVELVSRY